MARKKKRGSTKHVPERTCVACRTRRPKRQLIRIVRTESGLVIDESGKRSGRGAYLCPQRRCWEQALKRGALAHALRAALTEADREMVREYMASLS